MEPKTDGDHKQLLTEVIKKQIIVLGPDITLAKARNVQGLTVADDGTVTQISGDPKEVTQKLIEQFMELSGLIVKKTMEPLLANYPGLAAKEMTQQPTAPQPPAAVPQNPPPTPPPIQSTNTSSLPNNPVSQPET
ncbi:MAG: hypothetical protein HYZ02_01520 [Candidatus Levybacteria bacterium]|nr:hypothetical protein [Candidatus Levybacteria bacterium]